MKALLLNTPMSPCPGTHYAACTEFLEGFCAYGYTTGVASSIEEAKGAHILLLSNHKVDRVYLQELNDATPDTIFILWSYFHIISSIPFKHFILTGEHWLNSPRMASHLSLYKILPSIPNYVPLMLRANESPELIGTYPRTYRFNGCFIGTAYKPEWVIGLPNILYHSINHGNLLSYSQRRDIYCSSIIAFGFHSDVNISNYHPTQRIFEALSYGCVVLTDNPAAEEITGGIAVFVNSKADFLEKYQYYLTHPEECRGKQIEGYEWARLYGTNRYAASLFLHKIDELRESGVW